ncbi:MAG: hypothetical protein E7354_02805 [Clostridiales bacterium]|nr:hypothetical protein [Clostridiales bacterium]
MEENKSGLSFKKAIVVILFVLILITCGIVMSIILGKPNLSLFTVEYVNGDINILVQTYHKGEKLSLPENPQKTGFLFVGWSMDECGDEVLQNDQEVVVNNEFTLYAQWKEYQCVLEYNDECIVVLKVGASVNCKTNFLEINSGSGETVIIDNPSIVGHTFDGWQIYDGNEYYDITSLQFSELSSNSLRLLPKWKKNVYSITIYNEEELLVSEQLYGETISLPRLVKDGFSLVGFVDKDEQYIPENYIVSNDIVLYARWEIATCRVSFPNGKGAYVIHYGKDYLSSAKDVCVQYADEVSFSVKLSKAYDMSQISVYAESDMGINYPTIIDGGYVFDNIVADTRIIIGNVALNKYAVIVDDKDYGSYPYGSWLWVEDNIISIRDSQTNEVKHISTIINDDAFGGWFTHDNILVHNYIQDIVGADSEIRIYGNYSRKVVRITLNANGGVCSTSEIIYDENSGLTLPTPTRQGYIFVGWFTKLVEINKVVEEGLSERFVDVDNASMVLYAGWKGV